AITLPILAAIVTLVSSVAKKIFHQPRPLAYFRDLGEAEQLTFVEGVKVNQGFTSFPSGHTMAGFALFCFLALNLPFKKTAGFGLFCLAMIVGISRIYLVQHFLRDIYLGAILGVALAIGAYYFQGVLGKKAWLDGHLGFGGSANLRRGSGG
ncbi:MAG: phosphatase PAP2 family protein, partial [Bacteroidota bacterium]